MTVAWCACVQANTTDGSERKRTRHGSAALKRLNTPAVSPPKTQAVPETPDASLDADNSTGPQAKQPLSSANASPQRATARVRRHGAASSIEQSPAPAAEMEDALDLVQGASAPGPTPATVVDAASASLPHATGAGVSSVEKRPREGEGSGREEGIDEHVELHRRGAEQSYKVYHDVLAKRQRLTREVTPRSA